MLLCNGLALVIRLVIQKQSTFSFLFACLVPLIWTVFLYLFISNSGTPKRDIQGNLISPGSDLNQAGLMEWSWDVLYITWFCQVGSSILGEHFWWFFSIVSDTVFLSRTHSYRVIHRYHVMPYIRLGQ